MRIRWTVPAAEDLASIKKELVMSSELCKNPNPSVRASLGGVLIAEGQ
jgi:hypothetical protein